MHPVPKRMAMSDSIGVTKAPWQSGYAADCKSVDLGSTPGGASIISLV
ncbi:hypothetical protein VCHA47P369_40261 [Vibrio chagasii]|nr:hypothetical protein VCHA28O22_20335 [Vibrio chagasii]CAH6931900.1 hypothetical protein VCHA54O485_110137 [Vibrio chagasii]CAH7063082.1 hypothetical protein VCHA43P277_10332 [Vibrio chagasii]CAH7211584.1 hypothetical protein VCHA47P369_40261 [Vibrio chagasii]CAH7267867.1 hypothetical protein VCHA40O235_40146 [Vibrio chagasii]